MSEIIINTDAAAKVKSELTAIAGRLSANTAGISSAVQPKAFGVLGAFVAPPLNTLGSGFETAAAAVGTIAENTGASAVTIVSAFEELDGQLSETFTQIEGS